MEKFSPSSRGAQPSLANGEPRQNHVQANLTLAFAVDWMRKDLGICLDESRHNGARLPVAGFG